MSQLNPRAFLYHLLKKELKHLDGDVAIDAGCSYLVTTNFFRTKHYYGLEMQRDRLEEGLQQPDLRPNVIGVVADLTNLERLNSHCADVVVCTDVLFWLSREDQAAAVRELARICKSDGTLIVTVRHGKWKRDQRPYFMQEFERVIIRYYRGRISNLLTVVARWFPSLRPYLYRAWWLEYLAYRIGGANTFVVAKGKKRKESNQPFDLSRLKRLSHDLYSAANGPLP